MCRAFILPAVAATGFNLGMFGGLELAFSKQSFRGMSASFNRMSSPWLEKHDGFLRRCYQR